MMKWIDNGFSFPDPLQGAELTREPGRSKRIPIKAARHRFVVDQHCAGFVQRLPAALVEAQAQVHIVVRDGKVILVKPE